MKFRVHRSPHPITAPFRVDAGLVIVNTAAFRSIADSQVFIDRVEYHAKDEQGVFDVWDRLTLGRLRLDCQGHWFDTELATSDPRVRAQTFITGTPKVETSFHPRPVSEIDE